MFALMTRRLNDAGKSWALFLWLIHSGQIVLIILWCQEKRVPDKRCHKIECCKMKYKHK